MAELRSIHSVIANSIILYLLACGLWGLVVYFGRGRKGDAERVVSASYTGALLIGEGLIVVQGAIGAALTLLSSFVLPRDPMHLLYGIGSVLALPLAFTYVKGRTDRRAQLVYALVALFVFGLAVRALTTGTVR